MASCTAEAGASSANRTLCRGPLLRAGCSCAFELFFQQLFLVQIRVITAASEQFVVRAALRDGAFDQDDDLVGVANGGGAVRNQNRGAALQDSAQAVEDALLGLGVDARERVVEDENARIADNGAGDGGALLLPTGKSDAALADHGFVGFPEVLDVAMKTGDFGRFADALLVIFRQAEGDIAANGFAKQVSVLRNETDGLAERGERPFADGTAVDQDAVIRSFAEARDESSESGLSAAGGANNGERGAGGNFQIDVAKDGMLITAVRFGGTIRSGSRKSRWVSKGEMAEFDFATRLGACRNFRLAVIDIGLGGENVIEPAHGGGAALKNICDPSEGDHGPDEHGKKPIEGNESAEGNLVAEDLMTTLPQHNEKGCADERLERRHEHAPDSNKADVLGNVYAVGPVKAADF